MEVRIRPLPIPVISVMKSELCDFRVTKYPCFRGGRYQVFSVRYDTEYFTLDTVDTILFSIPILNKRKHQYRTNM